MNCPECGVKVNSDPVHERLSSMGYLHTDKRYKCENGHTFTRGIPQGQTESETWICPSCEGDYMPHFLYINPEQMLVEVKPKCQDCKYVPDERIELKTKGRKEHIRAFVGHHTTTGEDANMQF